MPYFVPHTIDGIQWDRQRQVPFRRPELEPDPGFSIEPKGLNQVMDPDMAHTIQGLRVTGSASARLRPQTRDTHIHIEHRIHGCCNRQWIPSPRLTVCACQVPTVSPYGEDWVHRGHQSFGRPLLQQPRRILMAEIKIPICLRLGVTSNSTALEEKKPKFAPETQDRTLCSCRGKVPCISMLCCY